jgi:hypothetical protein
MNCQTATPIRTQHQIASPVRRSLPNWRPQASRPCWEAYPDEETLRALASRITLRHPELFCLLAVAPDELQAIVDGFLA